jgi:exosortase C (VPDSG-CTERM-specific)
MNNRVVDSPAAGSKTALPEGSGSAPGGNPALAQQTWKLAAFILVLTGCLAGPLAGLVTYSVHSQFFSYILLIPFISIYLAWITKNELPAPSKPFWAGAMGFAVGGAALVLAWTMGLHAGWWLHAEDKLSLMTAAYVLFIAAGCCFFYGGNLTGALAFPLAFMVFMIPMPPALLDAVTLFFQRTSAVAAAGYLTIAGMPVFRDGLNLDMPGYIISVDPECSGIHSTMVLLITAVLAGHMFLRSNWNRFWLILLVLPLAILRNGFRIFVISEMCVRIGPDMIDSPIHRKGGPIFFTLSLIPFFLALYLLRKFERRASRHVHATSQPSL